MAEADHAAELAQRVQAAHESDTPLEIRGAGSKSGYGRARVGDRLDVSGHSGIVSYDPSELVLTARAGTPLSLVNAALDEAGQMLSCEPPLCAGKATLGGAVATGLNGVGRPWRGAVRDMLLGVVMLNGKGEQLRFGGQVMKNVAGFDHPRLMAGALGSLGVLLEVSLKVLPRPETEATLQRAFPDAHGALAWFLELAGRPWPISAALWQGGAAYLRLSGNQAAVQAAADTIGGDRMPPDECQTFWAAANERAVSGDSLWRLSLAATSELCLDHPELILDWGGAQRWFPARTGDPDYRAADLDGGHAALLGDPEPFTRPPEVLMTRMRRIKAAFDPKHLLNRGILYEDL